MSDSERTETSISTKISEILQELEGKNNTIGCEYLKIAIEKVYDDPETICDFLNSVCTPIAKEFETTYSRVEGNMRKAISNIWGKSNPSEREKYLGKALANQEEKPHNVEFVSTLARYLHMQEEPNQLQTRISKILLDVGVLPYTKGFRLISESIQIVYKNPELTQRKMGDIEQVLVKKYGMKQPAVDKAIKDSIIRAWNKGNAETIERYFGDICSNVTGRATKKQFITTIADYLYLEDIPQGATLYRITKILNELGISAQVQGYRFLQKAIQIVYEDSRKATSFTSEMQYNYGVKAYILTRSMLFAIEFAWKNMGADTFQKYFGETDIKKDAKPSNTQFVRAIVRYMIAEDKANN